jgi:hypothetical protein
MERIKTQKGHSMPEDTKKSSKELLDSALEMSRELQAYEKTKDRSVLIKALRDQFLARRLDSASVVEKTRLKALEVLIEKIPGMSENMLLRTISQLSEINSVDLATITGSGAKAGPLISIQQSGISGFSQDGGRVSLDGNPVKRAGELLESIEHIAAYFRRKGIIDLKKEE